MVDARTADVLASIDDRIIANVAAELGRAARLARLAGGRPPDWDATRLLVEKAHCSPAGIDRSIGWTDRTRSAEGRCRMLGSSDGAIAVNLARPADWDLLAAWLQATAPVTTWAQVERLVARHDRAELVDRAVLVGLAVALPGEVGEPRPVRVGAGRALRREASDPIQVVDISSLWAGPLAARLLAEAGADVTKIESFGRPDGLRVGSPELDRRLNGSKVRVRLELRRPSGRAALRAACEDADVVIDSSRPRAMSQLGIDVGEIVAGGTVWVSITGYGRYDRAGQRVAFGDDAAVAGGAWVDRPGGLPWFVGDALADPVSGVLAATAAFDALVAGEAGLVEIVMSDAVASVLPASPLP